MKLIIVEPSDADCIVANVVHQQNNVRECSDNELVSCEGKTESIMTGLNCGKPSLVSWPIIRDIATYFITIGDNWAKRAMKKMYQEDIIAGETGGAGIAAILAMPNLFDNESVILTINTEADTDHEDYMRIINEQSRL